MANKGLLINENNIYGLVYPPPDPVAYSPEAWQTIGSAAVRADVFEDLSGNFYTLVNGSTASLDTIKELADYMTDGSVAGGLVTSLAAKAPIDAPTFTGIATGVTAAAGANTTQLATTAFVKTAVDNVDVSAQVNLKANIASPTFTGIVTLPTIDGSSGDTAAATKLYVDGKVAGINLTTFDSLTVGTGSADGVLQSNGAYNLEIKSHASKTIKVSSDFRVNKGIVIEKEIKTLTPTDFVYSAEDGITNHYGFVDGVTTLSATGEVVFDATVAHDDKKFFPFKYTVPAGERDWTKYAGFKIKMTATSNNTTPYTGAYGLCSYHQLKQIKEQQKDFWQDRMNEKTLFGDELSYYNTAHGTSYTTYAELPDRKPLSVNHQYWTRGVYRMYFNMVNEESGTDVRRMNVELLDITKGGQTVTVGTDTFTIPTVTYEFDFKFDDIIDPKDANPDLLSFDKYGVVETNDSWEGSLLEEAAVGATTLKVVGLPSPSPEGNGPSLASFATANPYFGREVTTDFTDGNGVNGLKLPKSLTSAAATWTASSGTTPSYYTITIKSNHEVKATMPKNTVVFLKGKCGRRYHNSHCYLNKIGATEREGYGIKMLRNNVKSLSLTPYMRDNRWIGSSESITLKFSDMQLYTKQYVEENLLQKYEDINNSDGAQNTNINGGVINDTAIGGAVASSGKFTTLEATTSLTITAPTAALHAATKGYVDTEITNIDLTSQLSSKASLTGATFTGAVTLSGAPVGDLNAATKKYVDDNATTINLASFNSHIIPTQNAAYDIGSAEYKIRHIFVSDNSLWIGDDHKIDISGGKMKFKKRKKSTVPTSILAAHGGGAAAAETAALAHSGAANLSVMTLRQWEAYGLTLDVAGKGVGNALVNDIYASGTAADWDVDDDLNAASEAVTAAASANTANTLVKRDAEGNFSANRITTTLLVTGGVTNAANGNAVDVVALEARVATVENSKAIAVTTAGAAPASGEGVVGDIKFDHANSKAYIKTDATTWKSWNLT